MIKAKRFWEQVTIEDVVGGFVIMLDARVLKTPHQSDFVLPTYALGEAVAAEWNAVDGEIDPSAMPMTRMANSAIERVGGARAGVEAHLLEYIESDLLCYRVQSPDELVTRQGAWDEWIKWARSFGIALEATTGIVVSPQVETNQIYARAWLEGLSDFELVSFHEFVVITGSFVLATAIVEGAIDGERGFDLSRIDEDFQNEQWGKIEENQQERTYKLNALLDAENFLKSLHS